MSRALPKGTPDSHLEPARWVLGAEDTTPARATIRLASAKEQEVSALDSAILGRRKSSRVGVGVVLIADGNVIADGAVFSCLFGNVVEGNLPKAPGLKQSSMALEDGCH
jgi:hypothetical protein